MVLKAEMIANQITTVALNEPSPEPKGLLTEWRRPGSSLSVDVMHSCGVVFLTWIVDPRSKGRNALHAGWMALSFVTFMCR